jgi:hypothetical protein
MEEFMRAHHVIAVVTVLIIGFGAKQFLFPPKKAEANIGTVPTINVLQMHSDMDIKTLAVQKTHDMSLVFDSE